MGDRHRERDIQVVDNVQGQNLSGAAIVIPHYKFVV